MKKILSVLIIVVLILVSGCSNKDVIWNYYYFSGENDEWTGEYIINSNQTFTEKNGRVIYDSDSDTVFRVTYKGDISDLSSVKKLEISYETWAGGGAMTSECEEGGPRDKTFTMRGGGSGALLNEDDIIKVTINLDGKIQTLEFKIDKRYSST